MDIILTDANIKDAVAAWCYDEDTTTYGHISEWDTSAVTDMSELFKYAESFNDDISKWNVSKVTNMGWMFNNAQAFNQPIGNWDVSNVTDMVGMFLGEFSITL